MAEELSARPVKAPARLAALKPISKRLIPEALSTPVVANNPITIGIPQNFLVMRPLYSLVNV